MINFFSLHPHTDVVNSQTLKFYLKIKKSHVNQLKFLIISKVFFVFNLKIELNLKIEINLLELEWILPIRWNATKPIRFPLFFVERFSNRFALLLLLLFDLFEHHSEHLFVFLFSLVSWFPLALLNGKQKYSCELTRSSSFVCFVYLIVSFDRIFSIKANLLLNHRPRLANWILPIGRFFSK